MNNIPNLAKSTQDMLDNSEYTKVGNYIVSRKSIGGGSSATIYQGYEKTTGTKVAVKEIKNSKKLQAIVQKEIQIMKKLKHQNIVGYYDAIFDDNTGCINLILELSQMGDFSKFQNKRPIKEQHCKNYMRQLAKGLKYLYQNNITHRDLKPQNILVFNNSTIKITDFGFAKIKDKNAMSDTFCGSPLYMAPEILHYNNYDDKSDLWSVGCIMFEMLTGKPPFHVKNFKELLKRVKSEKVTLPPRISLQCRDLLSRLLEYNPSRRISWENFFDHPWFSIDDLMIQENHLLDFSISQSLSLANLPVKNSILDGIFDHKEVLNDSFQNFSFYLSDSQKKIKLEENHQKQIAKDIQDALFEKDNSEADEELFFSVSEDHTMLNDENNQSNSIEASSVGYESKNMNASSVGYESKNMNASSVGYESKNQSVVERCDMASQTDIDLSMRDIFESNKSTYIGSSQNEDLNQDYFNVSQNSMMNSQEIIIEETGDKFVMINTNPINIVVSNPERRRGISFKTMLADSVNSFVKDSYDYINDRFKSI